MKDNRTRALVEGAMIVALAMILGYIKLFRLPNGGSITLAMVPVFLYCVRWGFAKSMLACFAYGVLQLIFDGAYAYTWQSMLLDYILAYALLGVSGLFWRMKGGLYIGALAGSLLRLVSLTLSGVFVWGEYMPESFFGMQMTNVWVYSLLYNGSYVLTNLALALVIFALLSRPLGRYMQPIAA